MAVALRTEVFLVGAFSSAGVAGGDRGLLGGLGLCRSLWSGLDLCGLRRRLGLYCGLVLGLSLCLGSSSLGRGLFGRRGSALARGGLGGRLCLDSCLALGLGGRLLVLGGRLCGCLSRGGLFGRRLRSRGLLGSRGLGRGRLLGSSLGRSLCRRLSLGLYLGSGLGLSGLLGSGGRALARGRCLGSSCLSGASLARSGLRGRGLLSRCLAGGRLLSGRFRCGLNFGIGSRLLLGLGLLGGSGLLNGRRRLGLSGNPGFSTAAAAFTAAGRSISGCIKKYRSRYLSARARPAKVLAHGLRDQLVPCLAVIPEQACRAGTRRRPSRRR